MSIESFSPLPLNMFGTWVTLLDPSDVPAGMSPSLGDVEFFPGGVRTRPGLVAQYGVLGGAPKVNGLKTYVTTNLVQRLLALDSLGNLYKETSPGVLSLAASVVEPNMFFASTTHFGREYMAFSDGLLGQDLPRQYDDSNFDRVSQIGPTEGPQVADSTSAGSISPGVHECSVVFVTRQGYWTAPSPPVSWTAAGDFKVNVTNIPTGPSNVMQRLLTFTAAGGASFYHVPATMVVNDNTTTSVTVDFSDTILLSGVSMDYLFGQIELPEQLGVIDYAERLFWWGERAHMDNWRNPTFGGGWDPSGNGRPLGWQLDSTFGAGGSREPSDVVWGDAYRITADGATAVRGLISQGAITDVVGDPLCANNTDYSVRARVKRSPSLTAGTLRINAFSPTQGQIGTGLAVTAVQTTDSYQEFTADLFGPQMSLPADLTLRVYADGTPSPSGSWFLVDNLEVFETNASQNASLVRASATAQPESYDGVSGIMNVDLNNGQALRAAFTLRNGLYFVKERSMYVTATDGVNEPALWAVEEVFLRASTTNEAVFNNVLNCINARPLGGDIGVGDGSYTISYTTNPLLVNNTMMCNGSWAIGAPFGGIGNSSAHGTTGAVWQNSIGDSGRFIWNVNTTGGQRVTAAGGVDYNVYEDAHADSGGSATNFVANSFGFSSNTLSPVGTSGTWQYYLANSCGGCSPLSGSQGQDLHSVMTTNAALNLASDGTPGPGSPAHGAGLNLTSLCTGSLTPLCSDKKGRPRPATGAWDAGAVNFPASVVLPPFFSPTLQ